MNETDYNIDDWWDDREDEPRGEHASFSSDFAVADLASMFYELDDCC